MRRLFFLLVITSFSVLINAQNDALFNEANTLYNEGKYDEAIDKYEALLSSDFHSEALYYNLANAHYKLDHVAPSIYYFEKALQLNPNDKDIKNNLGFAQNMTIDAIDTVPEVGFARIFKNIVNSFSTETWAIIAIVGVFVFVLLFLMYHFAVATTQKRIAFIFSIAGIFLAGFALTMAYQKNAFDTKENPAIVFAQESRVKSDPNKLSEEVFRLHEGTKVQVIESYNDWYKIEIADKTQGWITSDDIKLINEF